MNAKWLVLILVCFLPACLPAADNRQNSDTAVSSETSTTPTPTSTVDAETRELIADYLALRKVPGQFTGGDWDEDVDRWLGRKHTAMLELGARLGASNLGCSQLTDLLQQPDHTVQGGDPLHDLIQSIPTYEPRQNEAA